MKKATLSVILVVLVGGIAGAETLSVEYGEASDYYTGTDVILNDISVDTEGAGWLRTLVYAELRSGYVFQDAIISPLLPAVAWLHVPAINDVDSWLTEYVEASGTAHDLADQPGMSGDPANAAVSITAIARTPMDPTPAWNGLAMRLALTPDANGQIVFTVLAEGSDEQFFPMQIVNGHVVPEPGTIALVLCGLVGLCLLRRG